MGLPKYIVNPEELAKLLAEGVAIRAAVSDRAFSELLSDYFDRLLEYLSRYLTADSDLIQCCASLHSYIPALAFDYELVHTFNEDAYITGITYSQTGWKVMDCFSLYVNGKLLFDSVFTKELGEYKHFNVFYAVKAGMEIKIVYHNNSGNSKQVWFDIEHFKKPSIPSFPAGRNWVIKVEWENGADIDCCWADASNNEILMGYATKSLGVPPNRIFRDWDNTNRNGSEIWSLEGKYRDKLKWGLGWYSSKEPEDVNIIITLYDGDGNIVDIREDVTGAMLGKVKNTAGKFLCMYEFDLTEPVYANQWKRVNEVINNGSIS